MSIIGNRFYFVCVLVFICYVSLAVHEIIDATGKTNEFGSRLEFINRSVVGAELNDKQYCRAPRVAILVSPSFEQFLQLYWDVEYVKEGDWIGLFKQDPQSGRETFPVYTIKVQNSTGFISTNITVHRKVERKLKFKSECLGFWAVYFTNNGTAAAMSCLKTQPTWMHDMKQQLENVQIKHMFIPGTHDSGSYITFDTLSRLNVVDRYVYTQDEDIINQLIFGIRYLDLRVSSNNHLEDRWWLNHGVIRVQPLQTIINDIKLFLRNTKEIVILDFHGFPVGFKQNLETHRDLVNYLKSELSEWIAPPNWSATCGQLWRTNKTLIISYNNDTIVKEYPSLLWSPVVQKWANVQNIDDLKKYFNNVIESRPPHSWAAMAELTPTFWTILTYQTSGLREMASSVNIHVTNWFRGVWGRTCNIVAVDFFRGTDIIEAAIEWNVRRNGKHICDIH